MLYGWLTGALPIQVGSCDQGRDLLSGQSCGGTIQQMAAGENEKENEPMQQSGLWGRVHPSSPPHRAGLGQDGMNEGTDRRTDALAEHQPDQ